MERVLVGFDSLTSTLKGSYIMNGSGSGEEISEETNGPPKDVTTNESPSSNMGRCSLPNLHENEDGIYNGIGSNENL